MSGGSDSFKKAADVPFKSAGTGLSMTFLCLGCGKPRPMIGRRGVGAKQRCAVCIGKRVAA